MTLQTFKFSNNNIGILVLLCFCYFISSELLKYMLGLNVLVYNTLAKNLTTEQLEKLFQQTRKWQLIGYLLLPVLLFIKTQIIAGVLGIGAYLFNKKIKHIALWSIVLKAEFIFLLVGVLKVVWFYFFQTNYTLENVQYYYPLSMLSVVGNDNLEPWYIYPLQTLNLFEVVYWIVLALLIDKKLKENSSSGIKIVASSYGPALIIWVVSIMFFTLNLS